MGLKIDSSPIFLPSLEKKLKGIKDKGKQIFFDLRMFQTHHKADECCLVGQKKNLFIGQWWKKCENLAT